LEAPTDGDFDKVSTQLDTARDSILAADCCIALLDSDSKAGAYNTNSKPTFV